MSLNGSMWTGVSGLNAHSQKMNVIGNNIANVGTVGFKSQRMDFADFVYQDTFSSAGISQMGRGVRVGTVINNFTQGSYETTTNATDLSITGKGFFKVEKPGSDESYYTRAGNFTFDKDGYLEDPNHLVLQGWPVDNTNAALVAAGGMNVAEEGRSSSIQGSGVPEDIKLDAWVVFPQKTTSMDFKVNLPRDNPDEAKNTSNPFAALFKTWDGTQPPPTPNAPAIDEGSYSEATTMEVFDESGTKHKITVYYDKVDSNDYIGGSEGESIWEYIVTMDPAEDKRQFWNESDPPGAGTLKKMNTTTTGGLLMSGTMKFSSAGALVNQSAYTFAGSRSPENNPGDYEDVPDPSNLFVDLKVINLDPENLKNWQPASISSNGLPLVNPNFTGILDAQTSASTMGSKYNIEINFGVSASNLDAPWDSRGSLDDLQVEPYVYNPVHNPANPITGPEYFLMNVPRPDPANPLIPLPGYDHLTSDIWNPATQEYQMGGVSEPEWTTPIGAVAGGIGAIGDIHARIQAGTGAILYLDGVNQVTAADYQTMLEYYGVDEVTIPLASVAAAVPAVPGPIPPPALAIPAIPSEQVTINIATGEVKNAAGIVDPAGLNYGLPDITDTTPLGGLNADKLAILISAEIKNEMAGARPTGLNLISAATPSNAGDIASFTEPPLLDGNATTSLKADFKSNQAQNGFGFGDLMSWNVDGDGVLSGNYSNGQTLSLWQISMYDFNSTQGLYREGNNLFSKSMASGEAKLATANSGGMGGINGYSLETSNVDMASELVQMIITQRGYQSNSKVITTSDGLLETVIAMVR